MKVTNWFKKSRSRVSEVEVDSYVSSSDGYIDVDKIDWVFASQVLLNIKRKDRKFQKIVLTMSPKEALEIGEHLVTHAKTRIRHEGPVTN